MQANALALHMLVWERNSGIHFWNNRFGAGVELDGGIRHAVVTFGTCLGYANI